jgi:hypothetical protein
VSWNENPKSGGRLQKPDHGIQHIAVVEMPEKAQCHCGFPEISIEISLLRSKPDSREKPAKNVRM